MAGRTSGPIKTKHGMGTHVDPWSVLVLTEARKGRENSSAKRDKYGGQRPQGRDNRARSAIANKTPDRGPQRPREFEREAAINPDRGPQGPREFEREAR